MVTRVNICNRALGLIGQPRLQAETDERGAQAIEIYNGVTEEVFAYPWRFSHRTQQLSRETAPPVIKWNYQFKLPADRNGPPRAAFDSADCKMPFKAWDLQGDLLLTDAEQIWCEYVIIPEPLQWPGDVRAIVVSLVAADLALAEREDAALRNRLRDDIYSPRGLGPSLMQRARTNDAGGRPSQSLDISGGPLVAARW